MALSQPLLLMAAVAALGTAADASIRAPNATALILRAPPKGSSDPAKESKMAAVNKVISLLEGLQSKVKAEGEEEAKTYNKFACFCKDTTTEKLESIKKGEDKKAELITAIGKLTQERDDLDTKIKTTEDDINTLETEIKEAEDLREKERSKYVIEEADLAHANDALAAAIKKLKASKSPTLAQLQAIAQVVGKAALMADALGLGNERTQKVATFFLQAVPSEDYTFHSDDIIKTLEKLQGDFKKKTKEVVDAETKAKAAHKKLVQAKTQKIEAKTKELETAQKDKSKKVEKIATTSQDLTTVAATLMDDKEYTTELAQMCGDKAKTWDQRTKVRAGELSALTAAIGILKGTVSDKTSKATIRFVQGPVQVRLAQAMNRDDATEEAVEAATEADEAAGRVPLAFLQRSGRGAASSGKPKDAEAAAQEAVVSLLRSKGVLLKSAALTSLAAELASDPFAKVKMLIQELIERMLKQAANENNQKGWCDKSTSAAKQKRDYAAQEVEDLNSNLAELEATRDELKEDLKILSDELKELAKKKKEAEDLRAQETKENAATVKEASEGLKAVQTAITALDRFYKEQAKAEVKLSLVQGRAKGVPEDAPDAGFEAGEAYKGSQGEAGGVIGMLEVIESDFQRTVDETEAAEEQARQDHVLFLTENGKSEAEKQAATKEKKTFLSDAEKKITDGTANLVAQIDIIKNKIKELLELKKVCEAKMSYKERVAKREEEMAALQKALCILTSFEKYGPDAAAAADC